MPPALAYESLNIYLELPTWERAPRSLSYRSVDGLLSKHDHIGGVRRKRKKISNKAFDVWLEWKSYGVRIQSEKDGVTRCLIPQTVTLHSCTAENLPIPCSRKTYFCEKTPKTECQRD